MVNEDMPRHRAGFAVELQKTAELVTKWKDQIDAKAKPSSDEREGVIYGYFLRAAYFFTSLIRLKHTSDFQSIIHIHRALIEISVDLILLANDSSDKTYKKMIAWEKSAKMKGADRLIKYYAGKGMSLPDRFKSREEYAKNERIGIEKERKKYWTSKKKRATHPMRWSGSNLPEDVHRASLIEDPYLEDEFIEAYDRLNWSVHGSGLTVMRNLDQEAFMDLCAMTCTACCRLILTCSQIALRSFDLFDADEWKRRNEEILAALTPYFLSKEEIENL